MIETLGNVTATDFGKGLARAVLVGAPLAVAPVSSSTPIEQLVPVRSVLASPNISRRKGRSTVEAASYFDVLRAIEKIASLDPDDEYHLTTKARREGEHLLALLRMFDSDVPRVFSQDSDSLVFSWDRTGGKIFLTVSDGRASLLLSTPNEKKIVATARLKDRAMVKLLTQASDNVERFANSTAER
ncbi:hypothetical protein [Mesorhizobium carmichaelinearum]|uniref:hypothetical protein n=1 Tax=Mesorhizobium carmichaelinearum TaxID=1208188 RepID=UPI000BA4D360|nr:hypothetical protein [Mesorhizobium carmichaelinearum]